MQKSKHIVFLGLAILLVVSLVTSGVSRASAAAQKEMIIRLGNPADVTATLTGPSYFLQGNGAPDIAPYQNHINNLSSTPIDIVVMGASFPSSGSMTPECDGLMTLQNVNSCTTVTFLRVAEANNADAVAVINQAEDVYYAGGDQCNYAKWKGSDAYTAIKNVVARNGGIGGGSAGLAIQGDYAYNACNGTVTSATALGNPYDRSITFTLDYFDWANLGQTITDSHFEQRDRMGRLMTFLARLIKDGVTTSAYGIGMNESTSLIIDKNGAGTVFGGAVYIVLADHAPEQTAAKKPLTFSNFKIWKLTAGSTYNFSSRPTSGYYLRSVTNGVISGNPYTP